MKFVLSIFFAFNLVFLLSLVAGAEDAKEGDAEQQMHVNLSVDCFNNCWKYIDKKDRTAEDTENMLLLANTSLWHWKQRTDCKPKNLAIAYWQLGRVNCLAGHLDVAKSYGQKCVELSNEKELGPFYLGYGYEVLADAAARSKDAKLAQDHLAKAKKLLSSIQDDFDRGLLKKDLERIEATLE